MASTPDNPMLNERVMKSEYFNSDASLIVVTKLKLFYYFLVKYIHTVSCATYHYTLVYNRPFSQYVCTCVV